MIRGAKGGTGGAKLGWTKRGTGLAIRIPIGGAKGGTGGSKRIPAYDTSGATWWTLKAPSEVLEREQFGQSGPRMVQTVTCLRHKSV